MIAFSSIQDRLLPMRPDKLAREVQLAYQIAARRFATETLMVQEVTTFTVAAGARVASVYALSAERDAVFIIKAERLDGDVPTPLEPLNSRLLREGTLKIAFENGTLYGFVSQEGAFLPYQPPQVDTQVRALVAYKPVGDFDEIDLPHSMEDALVDGALSHLFRLPGSNQNVNLAEVHERRFLNACADAKGASLIGITEYARVSHRPRSWGIGWGRLRK